MVIRMKFESKVDLCNSYLIAKIEDDYDINNYQLKMITHNNIPGFLRCKETYLEGKYHLQYEVSGKKSLLKKYQDKEMEFEDIVIILEYISAQIMQMKEYLLHEKYLLLEPKYMYWDDEWNQAYFLFYPAEEGEMEGKLRKLADFFLEYGNHKDIHVVNISYLFYKLSKEPFFSLSTFLELVEKERLMKNQEDNKELLLEEKMDTMLEKELLVDELKIKPEENKEIGKPEKSTRKYIIGIICSFLISGIVAGLSYVIEVTYEQKIGLIGLSISCGLIGFALLIKWIIKKKSQLRISTGGKSQKENEIEKEEYNNREKKKNYSQYEIGETTYLGDELYTQKEKPLILRWQSEDVSRQEVLDNLPITVGKLVGKVNMVLTDSSVSRMHCKFMEKAGGIALIDLQSTNGTAINGILLEDGEIVSVKRGDEILIGKVLCEII